MEDEGDEQPYELTTDDPSGRKPLVYDRLDRPNSEAVDEAIARLEAKWAAERASNASATGSSYTAPGSAAEKEFRKQSARSKSVVEGGDQSLDESPPGSDDDVSGAHN